MASPLSANGAASTSSNTTSPTPPDGKRSITKTPREGIFDSFTRTVITIVLLFASIVSTIAVAIATAKITPALLTLGTGVGIAIATNLLLKMLDTA